MKVPHPATPSPVRQKDRSEATRRKIIESAKEIFARDGFQSARLEEITEHAGYTRGAFYANFSSKEELFMQVAEKQIEGFAATARAATARVRDVKGKCEAMVDMTLNDCNVARWALMLTEFHLFTLRNSMHRGRIEELDKKLRHDFHDVFADLYAALPHRPKLSIDAASMAFGAFFQGLVLQAMTHMGVADKKLARQMLLLFLYAALEIR